MHLISNGIFFFKKAVPPLAFTSSILLKLCLPALHTRTFKRSDYGGDLWPTEVNCRLIKKKPTHHASIHSWLWLGFDSMWLILVELETAGWQQEVDVSAPSPHRFVSGLATNSVSVGGGGRRVFFSVWEKSVKRVLRQSFGDQSAPWIVPC